jgi:hypothetical protein
MTVGTSTDCHDGGSAAPSRRRFSLTNRRSSAPVARRRLGDELARLRGVAKQTDAARSLGWAPAKLRYLEAGTRPLPLGDLPTVFDVYDVGEADRSSLERLCQESNTRGWWDGYADVDLSPAGKRYVGLEYGATRIRRFEALLIPGLFQTADYARDVLRASLRPRATEQVATLVEVRRQRQQVLTGPDPLEFWAIVDEAALHRRVGAEAVMRDQLEHVADLAESVDRVTVQVVPFEAGPHPGLGGPFSLLEFGFTSDPGLVYLEPQSDRPTYLEDREDVYAYSQAFDRLVEIALSPDDSVEMLRSVAARSRARKARG